MKKQVSIMNKSDRPVKCEGYTFLPDHPEQIEIETNSAKFRNIRTNKKLAVLRVESA
jgi:hypothetical protein